MIGSSAGDGSARHGAANHDIRSQSGVGSYKSRGSAIRLPGSHDTFQMRASTRRVNSSAKVTSPVDPEDFAGDEVGFQEKGDCFDDLLFAAPSAERR